MADRPPPPKVTRADQPAVPRAFRPLPESATLEQIVHALHEQGTAYANIAAGFNAQLPALIEDHRELRVVQEAHGVRLGRLEVWRDEVSSSERTTERTRMRDRFDSSHDVAASIGEQAARAIAEEQLNPSTPPPDAAKIRQLIEDPVKTAVDRIKAGWWDKLEEERKANERERMELVASNAKERNKAKWKIVVAFVLTGISVLALLAEHFVLPGLVK